MKVSALAALAACLASATSATDIRHWINERDCRGMSYACNGIGPSICCPTDARQGPVYATGFNVISNRARAVDMFGSIQSDGCGYNVRHLKTTGGGDACVLANEPIGGASWSTLNWKPRGNAVPSGHLEEDEPDLNIKCTGTAKPDELTLQDGTSYNITGMPADLLDNLWELGLANVGREGMPAQFDKFIMVK